MPKTYSALDPLTATDYNAVVKVAGLYAADAGSTDAYAITCSPAPTSYAAGDVFHFLANTVNTGACTLNVNSLGAKTIKKNKDTDLSNGDIKAGQLVCVIYDGTNFQLLSPTSNTGGTSFPESTAFSGTSPTSYTDLDLSSIVGAAQRCVLLKVAQTGDSASYISFRKNGDTDVSTPSVNSQGANSGVIGNTLGAYFITTTDTAGVVEWMQVGARSVVITVMAYW